MQNKLTAIQTFVRVAEAGSFSAAARQNGMKQSAVSQQIAALEEALGVVLLHRTTRTMALTESGQHYLQQVRQLLGAMDELEQQLRPGSQPLHGRVHIQLPSGIGQRLMPHLIAFQQAHPALRLNIALEDRLSDLVAEGVDVAIRLSESPPATLAARSLATVETVLVASPEWLARNDPPQTPDDLMRHPHIRFSGIATDAPLQLISATAKVSVPVESVFRSNNSDALMQALEAGLGIGGLQTLPGAEALASGRLVRVLPDWRLPDRYLYAVFPDARFIPDKVRKLVGRLSEVVRVAGQNVS
ncbi:LysR family transcriptional regulator [Pantoea sp. Bo_2]|uniref:LysR family transcriptional regulator n=1 Tax=Candidatus Pantoea gossypiicola TaxID=2608008 RepID=A0AB34CUK8_9GAMM|nr:MULTISPECIES: LysR family transcriptional regulator [Pantoea]KAA5931681.1 LysR family transcriptional regulator [Pantoea sp. VH_8]KAA5936816.1 LysR family transcriptional regulator [Pantoea sp. VH_4]KAA5948372.1 LysR family transcriptional regulator [Pantoea sp. VH_3]KAA5953642.1 LysR family transcriptional regulator [Pantoea sp. VH_25]KAA5960369.1 LysR family transcriptional regulator [Pantoea sp. VH_16]